MAPGLRNTRAFPSFPICPAYDDTDTRYSDDEATGNGEITRHWCLLAEITSVEIFVRLRLECKDKSGNEFIIAFYLENGDKPPNTSQYKVGRTIAILYAHKHTFLDKTRGVRQDNMDAVQVSAPFAG